MHVRKLYNSIAAVSIVYSCSGSHNPIELGHLEKIPENTWLFTPPLLRVEKFDKAKTSMPPLVYEVLHPCCWRQELKNGD